MKMSRSPRHVCLFRQNPHARAGSSQPQNRPIAPRSIRQRAARPENPTISATPASLTPANPQGSDKRTGKTGNPGRSAKDGRVKKENGRPSPCVESDAGRAARSEKAGEIGCYSTIPCGPTRPGWGYAWGWLAARRRTSSSIAPKVPSWRWMVMLRAVSSRFAV